jgi:mycothiol synthase
MERATEEGINLLRMPQAWKCDVGRRILTMNHQLPPEFQSRPATMDDLEPTVKMLNTWSMHKFGMESFELNLMDSEWTTPGFELERDTRLVLAPNGEIVGYNEVWDIFDPHVHVYSWARVHPEYNGCGIGTHMMAWAEQRARMAPLKAPPEARVTLLGHCLRPDTAATELFRNSGFKLIRYSLRMVIELNGTPPEPVWPEGVTVRSLVVGQDEPAALEAVNLSFRDHWGYVERPFKDELEHWKHVMETDDLFDASLWFLAVAGDRVIGTALNYPYVDDDHEMGWVGTLGVVREWRRNGVGRALLQHSFREFHRRGLRKVGLGVDAQNLTGATRLYLKAGMHPDPNREWSMFEKEIRPGQELGPQSV